MTELDAYLNDLRVFGTAFLFVGDDGVLQHIPYGETLMPPKSKAQRGAMAAAASGKSTLGIPPKVGKEFMAADKGGKLPAKAPKPKGKAK